MEKEKKGELLLGEEGGGKGRRGREGWGKRSLFIFSARGGKKEDIN